MHRCLCVVAGSLTLTAVQAAGGQANPRSATPSRDQLDTGFVIPDPANLVRKESFSVVRGGDGHCQWMSAIPTMKRDPVAESIFVGEKHESTCQGKFYLVTIPPEYRIGATPAKQQPGLRTTTGMAFTAWVWEGPDTLRGRGRELRNMVNLIQPALPPGARVEQMQISDDTVGAAIVNSQPKTTYNFRRRRDSWVVVGKPVVWPAQPPIDSARASGVRTP